MFVIHESEFSATRRRHLPTHICARQIHQHRVPLVAHMFLSIIAAHAGVRGKARREPSRAHFARVVRLSSRTRIGNLHPARASSDDSDDARAHSKTGEFIPEEVVPHTRHAPRRGEAVVVDRDAAHMTDPATARPVMVYECTLPAIDMGLVFHDVGARGPCVRTVIEGGHADLETGIKPGDVLIRCTATELTGDPARPTIQRVFDCKNEDFETCMRALNSTGIVDAGFIHRRVHCMFKRDAADTESHEREENWVRAIAAKGRLEVDREAAGKEGSAPRESPERAEPLYEDQPPAWDD